MKTAAESLGRIQEKQKQRQAELEAAAELATDDSGAALDYARMPPEVWAERIAATLRDFAAVGIHPALAAVGFIGLAGGYAMAQPTLVGEVSVTVTVAKHTSLSPPELAVSVGAAWRGETDLAVGNVVGSNIANILLILGVTAILRGRGRSETGGAP